MDNKKGRSTGKVEDELICGGKVFSSYIGCRTHQGESLSEEINSRAQVEKLEDVWLDPPGKKP